MARSFTVGSQQSVLPAEFDERAKGYEVWDDKTLCVSDGKMLFRPGELEVPALLFVMRAVNQELREKASVNLMLRWSVERRRAELTCRARNLLGAMYWQFVEALDKGRKYRQCPVCLKSFQLARGEARANRLTCSDTCRTYLYRRRMRQAYQLHQQGQSPAAIAKKLKTTKATVQKWIAKEQSS